MKVITLSLSLLVLVAAQNSNSTDAGSAATTSVSPDYTITALPAVQSAPSCIFNCLIPIGLAEPSGCDDVTNDCACLSAPSDGTCYLVSSKSLYLPQLSVLDVLTGCINAVCLSSTSAFGTSATSLYESYCNSIYGTAVFTSAFEAEASAAASSSSASVEASITSAGASPSKTSAVTSPSATKSGAMSWEPSL